MGQRKIDREWAKPKVTRHVWVQSPESHQPPDPGLLITWDRQGSVWWAWVITILDRPDRGSPAVLQRWYHERDVIAAPTRPESPDRGRWHLGWMGESIRDRGTH